MRWIRNKLETILTSGGADLRRPVLRRGNESSVRGLHIIGDLAGAPVIKLAMAQGIEIVDYLAERPEMKNPVKEEMLDLLIVGAGAAGLNAALAAQERNMSYVLIEKGKIANTIEQFPEGKWIYAEPDSKPAKGKLWLDGAAKEDLVQRWHAIVNDNGLDIRTEEALTQITRHPDGTFTATSSKQTYQARKIILATGQRGNPRKLNVPGEDMEVVYHRLYS